MVEPFGKGCCELLEQLGHFPGLVFYHNHASNVIGKSWHGRRSIKLECLKSSLIAKGSFNRYMRRCMECGFGFLFHILTKRLDGETSLFEFGDVLHRHGLIIVSRSNHIVVTDRNMSRIHYIFNKKVSSIGKLAEIPGTIPYTILILYVVEALIGFCWGQGRFQSSIVTRLGPDPQDTIDDLGWKTVALALGVFLDVSKLSRVGRELWNLNQITIAAFESPTMITAEQGTIIFDASLVRVEEKKNEWLSVTYNFS